MLALQWYEHFPEQYKLTLQTQWDIESEAFYCSQTNNRFHLNKNAYFLLSHESLSD